MSRTVLFIVTLAMLLSPLAVHFFTNHDQGDRQTASETTDQNQ
jgi:hypothetical protein